MNWVLQLLSHLLNRTRDMKVLSERRASSYELPLPEEPELTMPRNNFSKRYHDMLYHFLLTIMLIIFMGIIPVLAGYKFKSFCARFSGFWTHFAVEPIDELTPNGGDFN